MISPEIIQAAREAPPTDDYRIRTEKFSETELRDLLKKNPRINWNLVSLYQDLSEDFIREFKDKVSWTYVSKHQILSEGFIREFSDKVFWPWISLHQELSENFIREFIDRFFGTPIRRQASDELKKSLTHGRA